MSALERLRQAIDLQQRRLRASVPADRQTAILALLKLRDGRDQRLLPPDSEPSPDLVTGRHIADLGGNRALQLCLEPADDATPASRAVDDLDGWAEHFLEACGQLARSESVVSHCETGFMQLVEDRPGSFDAWIATKRVPTTWRERADVEWWASSLARRHEPELRALLAKRTDLNWSIADRDNYYHRLAALHLKSTEYQLGYPPDAMIGGVSVRTYRDVLARLIRRALLAHDDGTLTTPQSERALVAALSAELTTDPASVARALSAFTLTDENATYHGAVAGVAAAPLVRVAPDLVAWSLRGLTTQPLFFMLRELRRRAAQDYHNTAFLRESVFRQDLYAIFSGKRFVTSTARIELRREAGDVRTDIDAVVFDRKSGALGLFELKSQDPFARSSAELVRQRDNVLYANRQVSGVLTWIQRHGAQALVERINSRTAKTFRAQKVYPFVLGRYLAHFSDGPEPDRRAAWGAWPQLLRLLDSQPVRATDANPIASLFTRLSKDAPQIRPPADDAPREINLGDAQLTVHGSYAAFRTRAEERASPSG